MTSRKPNKVPSIKDRENAQLATKRGVSVRLLLGTAIVLALAAAASYAWRNYQVKRLAPDLLKQAEALEAQGKLAESTQRIFQYLQINPDDAEAKITLAEKYDAAAQDVSRKLRAIELYSQALPTAPASKQAELHRRRGTLLLEVALLQLRAIDPEVQQQKAEVTGTAGRGGRRGRGGAARKRTRSGSVPDPGLVPAGAARVEVAARVARRRDVRSGPLSSAPSS